jgi:1-acyl-sn-glycerol-3-phosphate acyltransferase
MAEARQQKARTNHFCIEKIIIYLVFVYVYTNQIAMDFKKNNYDFHPPSKSFAENFIKPFKLYFDPQFYGLENLDASKPALYVSNHTILGVLDGYPFAIELYLQKGIILRALADSMHYQIPLWRDLITERLGVVEASRENCAALMKRGDNLVVFPGGTREICKRKGEEYVLKWSDRTGFVKMALQHGYDIIPVAAVGAEEAFTVVKDANDFFHKNIIGKFLSFTGLAETIFKSGDRFPPTVKGLGNTILPRPEKLYFSFGKRISTEKFKGKESDPEVLNQIKSKVEVQLLKQFKQLFKIRDKDKDINPLRKLLTKKEPS